MRRLTVFLAAIAILGPACSDDPAPFTNGDAVGSTGADGDGGAVDRGCTQELGGVCRIDLAGSCVEYYGSVAGVEASCTAGGGSWGTDLCDTPDMCAVSAGPSCVVSSGVPRDICEASGGTYTPGGGGASCDACGADETCVDGACVAAGADGATCAETIDCANACSTPTEACLDACGERAAPAAARDFAALVACLDAQCASAATPAEYESCQRARCAGELDACFDGSRGSDPCTTVFDCLYACRTGQDCFDACTDEGSLASAEAAVELYNCGVANCASAITAAGFASCARTECPTEATACDAN